jgi:phospholipid/cholesterol/gamma-HCH transport system substrate-binding protein
VFETKKQLRWSKIKVGLVVTIAFLILLVAVFFAGNIQNIFLKKAELEIQFKDVVGLRKGAPVWILGIEEGSVKNITLDPTYGVIVTIAVDKKALGFVKKDSRAAILTMGLLGDKYIELSTGSPREEPIQPGEMIKGSSEMGLREVMGQFIEKMDSLVTKIDKGQGTIPKLLNDPALYNDLTKATHNLSALVEDIKNSRGTLKLLIEDPSVYKKISAAASSLEEFSTRINESSGTLKNLVEDPSLYNKTLAAASQIEEFSRKLSEGSGTLKKLIEDPELYENLNKASSRLSSILEGIEKGKGMAGAFVRDEELVKELRDLLVEFKKLSANLEALAKDIKEHPKKYFKFSLF